jgi:hypothetical protein
VIPYLLDVKTVTGVAYKGEFHSVATVEDIEKFAAEAYQSGEPLLLEIEFWARRNPRDHKTSLEHASTSFYKLQPQRPITEIPDLEFRKASAREVPRELYEFTQARGRSRSL